MTDRPHPNAHSSNGAQSVELFSGCGGLAFGLSHSGFNHRLLVEWDKDACSTLEHNKSKGLPHLRDWTIQEGDVRYVDWTQFAGVELVAGGPPCQPFSIGGKHNGYRDGRDMWPEAIRAVREIRPSVFLFENVRGLLRTAFTDYVQWIQFYLSSPTVVQRSGESHSRHLKRLVEAYSDREYEVIVVPANAADYGVAQKRNRVVVAGVKREFNQDLTFPTPTHTRDRLIWDKWISKEYWRRHGIRMPQSNAIPDSELRIVDRLRSTGTEPKEMAWLTCRDAFIGLGEPSAKKIKVSNHQYQAGARTYTGHTGSPYDEPAKALKAGVHGVPGGENMLQMDNGDVRYFTVREAARLQGLPDEFEFTCSWSESMRQLGNAVPVTLAQILGEWMKGLTNISGVSRKAA